MLQQNFTTTAAFTLYHKRISGASLSIHDFSTRRTRNWWKTALALNGRLRNTQNTHSSSPNVSPHFPSKSLHSDPKLPFTAARTSGVNPRESTFGRRLIITRTGRTRGGGGRLWGGERIHHLSRKVRSPLCLSKSHLLTLTASALLLTGELHSPTVPNSNSSHKTQIAE